MCRHRHGDRSARAAAEQPLFPRTRRNVVVHAPPPRYGAEARFVCSRAERRDRGGASGSRRVIHIFDRCNYVACAAAGARPRATDSASAPLACIDDWGALYVSDKAWEGGGDLSFATSTAILSVPSSPNSVIAYVSCLYRIDTLLTLIWETTLEETCPCRARASGTSISW